MAYKTAPPIIITIVLACFWGESIGQRPGQTVLSCRCSPHFLPQSPKVGAGRGNGGGNRIVTQMRSLGLGQVMLRNCLLALSPFLKGEMLSVFFFFVFCGLVLVLCRFFGKVLFFLGSVCATGTNFCFCSLFGSVCCWYGFAYGFCVFSRNFALEVSLKNSLDVRSCSFSSRSLCLRVWVDDVVCVVSLLSLFLEEIELRANRTPHTPPRTCCCFSFSCSVPAALFCSPVLAVRPFSFWCFFGVPFWAPCAFWILSGLL